MQSYENHIYMILLISVLSTLIKKILKMFIMKIILKLNLSKIISHSLTNIQKNWLTFSITYIYIDIQRIFAPKKDKK